MNITAKGILKHHFHREYWSEIILYFPSAEMAEAATPAISVEGLDKWTTPVHMRTKDVIHQARIIALYDTRDSSGKLHSQTELMADHLATLGADRKKITSLACSIDSGEPFSLDFNVAIEDKRQMELNLS